MSLYRASGEHIVRRYKRSVSGGGRARVFGSEVPLVGSTGEILPREDAVCRERVKRVSSCRVRGYRGK